MAVIGLKGVRGHSEGSSHYGQKVEWNQRVEGLPLEAKKAIVKLAASENYLVFVLCFSYMWIPNLSSRNNERPSTILSVQDKQYFKSAHNTHDSSYSFIRWYCSSFTKLYPAGWWIASWFNFSLLIFTKEKNLNLNVTEKSRCTLWIYKLTDLWIYVLEQQSSTGTCQTLLVPVFGIQSNF